MSALAFVVLVIGVWIVVSLGCGFMLWRDIQRQLRSIVFIDPAVERAAEQPGTGT